MQKRGYWFNTDSGEVIDVTHDSHIRAVTRAPERFGLTRDEIERAYAEAGEPIPFEGKARGLLLRRILATTTWVRIREYEGRDGYWITVNLNREDQKAAVRQRFDFDEAALRWDL